LTSSTSKPAVSSFWEHRNPHNSGGFHRHRLDLALLQPLDHLIQLRIENPKLAHGALAGGHTVGGDADKVGRIAQINPRSVRMHGGHLLGRLDLASGNGFGRDLFSHNWIMVELQLGACQSGLWAQTIHSSKRDQRNHRTMATPSPISTPPAKGTTLNHGHSSTIDKPACASAGTRLLQG
jgi:hypothetical protein